MKSVTTSKFRGYLEKLPEHIQVKARKTYRLWLVNPLHPSLQFKQIHSISPIYAVRISLGYRALGILEDDTMVWFWIGSHEEYNSMIKNI
jgi:hypothetical protein